MYCKTYTYSIISFIPMHPRVDCVQRLPAREKRRLYNVQWQSASMLESSGDRVRSRERHRCNNCISPTSTSALLFPARSRSCYSTYLFCIVLTCNLHAEHNTRARWPATFPHLWRRLLPTGTGRTRPSLHGPSNGLTASSLRYGLVETALKRSRLSASWRSMAMWSLVSGRASACHHIYSLALGHGGMRPY